MEKKNDKKLTWKKAATIGGVFLLGMVVGAVSGEKVLSAISRDDDTHFGMYVFNTTNHSALIRFTTTSPKTGRKLHARFTDTGALELLEELKKTLNELGVAVDK